MFVEDLTPEEKADLLKGRPPGTTELDEVRPGEHWRVVRRRLGVSERRMAAAIGLDRKNVREMERGRKSVDPLERFWRRYGLR